MRTAYYLEVKNFRFNKSGRAEQIFDIGIMPIIYGSYEQAQERASKMVDLLVRLQGQKIVKRTSKFDEDLPASLYRRKLVKTGTLYYTYISIYEISIH